MERARATRARAWRDLAETRKIRGNPETLSSGRKYGVVSIFSKFSKTCKSVQNGPKVDLKMFLNVNVTFPGGEVRPLSEIRHSKKSVKS